MVIGSAAIDVTAKQSSSKDILSATTARGSVSFTPGGVGRNIAEAASKLLMVQNSNETTGQPVVLVSAVGATTMMKPKATTMCEDEQERDSFGRILFDDMVRTGMRTDGLIHRSSSSDEDNANDQQQSTAVCNLVLDAQGGLVAGVADMGIAETITLNEVSPSNHVLFPVLPLLGPEIESRQG